MHELTPASWIVRWQWSWPGGVIALILAAVYLALWFRGRGKPGHPNVLRLIAFLSIGVGTLLYVTCGPIGVYSRTFLWMFAFEVATLTAITPLGIALGRPVELTCAATGSERPRHLLAGRLGRLLMYPLVSSVLSAVSILAVFLTGYGQSALTSSAVEAVLVIHLLVVGVLVVLPLLTDDLLPAWATPGVRALLAAVDGLVDAIPGIVVMTASHALMPHFPGFSAAAARVRDGLSPSLDQKFAGGALLGVAEAIGIPLLIAVFAEWMRADAAEARETDARLDAEQAARRAQGEGPVGEVDGDDRLMKPWWLDGR